MRPDTLLELYRDFTKETGESLSPNMAVLLSGGLLTWGNFTKRRIEKTISDKTGTYGMRAVHDAPAKWEPSWSAQKADILEYSEDKEPFRALIRWVYEIYRTGKTSDARAFDRYFLKKDAPNPSNQKFVPKSDMPLETFLQSLGITQFRRSD